MDKLWRRLRNDSDAALTFLLSNLILLASSGLTLLPILLGLARLAYRSPCTTTDCRDILVLGHRLEAGGRPSAQYRRRLNRAQQLLEDHPQSRAILLGGQTGDAPCSEAAAGRDYLLARGVSPSRIALEEASTHTLENLVNARQLLGDHALAPAVMVTSRAHLGRSLRLVRDLGIKAHGCAAESRLGHGPGQFLGLLQEAYLLHWYLSGRAWSRLTRNRRMLDRIS